MTGRNAIVSGAVRSEDAELAEILDRYLVAVENGEAPDEERLLAEHPRVASRLRDCFESLRAIELGANQITSAGALARPRRLPRLDDFHIIREIGRGGMGVVYEAEQHSLQRRVALKILPLAAMLDPRHLQRFKNEALITAHLDHPHIVRIHNVGCERGTHYFAMQLIDGQSLADAVAELRRPQQSAPSPPDSQAPAADAATQSRVTTWADTAAPGKGLTERSLERAPDIRAVARIGRQAAEALQYAHENGVMHRDIKPSNLLVDARGDMWIADFGLARLQNSAELTLTGDMLGTLRYMSPEQAQGKNELIDHRTDIYSLGATLYELLTLRAAVEGESREEILHNLTFQTPKSPRSINAHIPGDLETILLKTLEHERDDRYRCAGELAEDLRRFLEDLPVLAKRPSLIDRTRKWARRKRGVVLALFVSLVVLLLGSLLSTGLIYREQTQTAEALEALKAEQEGKELALRDAKRATYQAKLSQAEAKLAAHHVGHRLESLAAIAEAMEVKDESSNLLRARNLAIASLGRTDLSLEKDWELESVLQNSLAFDRDCKRYAYTEQSTGDVVARSVGGAEAEVRIPTTLPTFVYGFTPDGRYLVLGDATPSAKFWHLERQEFTLSLPTETLFVAGDFSPDGRKLAYRPGSDPNIILIDIDTHEADEVPLSHPPSAFCFCSDGRRLVVAKRETQEVRTWDLQTRKWGESFGRQDGVVVGLACHPAGELLAGVVREEIIVWNWRDRTRRTVLSGHQDVAGCRFSHDGKLLVSLTWSDSTRLWDPWTGLELVSPPSALRPQWGRGGRIAFTANNRGQIWRVHPRAEMNTLVAANRNEHLKTYDVQSAVHPAGRIMASTAVGGVRLWDLATLREVAQLPIGWQWFAKFDAAGHLITNGGEGIHRWPVSATKIGPPVRIGAKETPFGHIALSQMGTTLAAVDESRPHVNVFKLALGESFRLKPIKTPTKVATSVDGKWVAATGGARSGVRIWNVRSRELTKHLHKSEFRAEPCFSPDGKWLVVAQERGLRFWSVETWTRAHAVEGIERPILSFSRGAAVTAALTKRGITLLDTGTGDELAYFESPYGVLTSCCFSPDMRLLVGTTQDDRFHVWDLGLIRSRLAELGLDWSDARIPTAPAAREAPDFEVELGGYWHP